MYAFLAHLLGSSVFCEMRNSEIVIYELDCEKYMWIYGYYSSAKILQNTNISNILSENSLINFIWPIRLLQIFFDELSGVYNVKMLIKTLLMK